MAPPRRRPLPHPLPAGFVLTDNERQKWKLGNVIGQGGFGLIYLASPDVNRPVRADTEFVIKVEYHENGPLFTELKFYQRAAKKENMDRWIRSRGLDSLGIPIYWGSGLTEYKDLRYRFMVMERLGSDYQKVCECNRGRLKKSTVLQLGQELVDILEYIHENEYVHSDIKAANLMQGYQDPDKVYLVDYGLSYRYRPDGNHKDYQENPKKGHDGTIEYTSIDAHKGVAPSRRSDLQILGFNLLHWLCGSLPWSNVLRHPVKVQEAKIRLMDNLPESVKQLSVSGAGTDEIARFLQYVGSLGYQERPDYQLLKDLLTVGSRARPEPSSPRRRPPTSQLNDVPTRGKRASKAGAPPKSPSPMELDDTCSGDLASIPVPSQYIRGPPPNKAQTEQAGKAVVRRSPRTKPHPVDYADWDTSEEEDDYDDDEYNVKAQEEEAGRPRPIAARHIRGPPIGPRDKPGQAKTNSKRGSGRTDDLPGTSQPEEVKPRLRPRKRRCISMKCDHNGQTQIDFVETWDEQQGRYVCERWPDDKPCHRSFIHRDGQWEEAEVREPTQHAAPMAGERLLRWSALLVFCFFMLVVAGLLSPATSL